MRHLLLGFVLAAGLFSLSTSVKAAGTPDMLCVQEQLNALGYDTGTPDGVIGGKTRDASEAYLASQGAVAGLPPISNDTAGQWCTDLAAAHAEAAPFAAERPDDVVVGGDGLSAKQKATLEHGLLLAHDLLKRRVGFVLNAPVKAYAGTDATWLTDNYLRERNLPASFRNGKMQDFGSCEPSAEGGYYLMFLCMTNKAWERGDAESLGIVVHEYTHNMQFGLVGEPGKDCCRDSNAMSIFGPQWLVEGSAEYMKFLLWDEIGYQKLSRNIRDYTRKFKGADLSLAAMESRKGFRDNPSGWDIAPVAVHYLLQSSGIPSLAVFWAEIGKGTAMRDAFQTAFGRSTEQFDAEFAAAVK